MARRGASTSLQRASCGRGAAPPRSTDCQCRSSAALGLLRYCARCEMRELNNQIADGDDLVAWLGRRRSVQ